MWFNIATIDNDWMRKWSRKCPFRAIYLFTHIFDLFPNNRLVETCCDRTKIVCCGQVCRRSDNKLAEQVVTNLLISTDLLQVVLSDLLSLVSNRFVAGCFNKSLRLCCQQLATDLIPQACYRLTKPTDLSRLVDNLPLAGKINSLRQACEISGCILANILWSFLPGGPQAWGPPSVYTQTPASYATVFNTYDKNIFAFLREF
jgi:hypothetical protein